MIRHVWTVLCLSSAIDRDSNALSLLNILETLAYSRDDNDDEPESEQVNVPFEFEIVSLWTRNTFSEPTEGRVQISMINPSGAPPENQFEYEVNLVDHVRLRYRVRVAGITITGPGRYEIRVNQWSDELDDWQHVTDVPLDISYRQPIDI